MQLDARPASRCPACALSRRHGTTTIGRAGQPDEARVLSAALMAQLRDQIDAADFPSLDDEYDTPAFDDWFYDLTVRFEQGSYRVKSTDSSEAPDALWALEVTLTEIERH